MPLLISGDAAFAGQGVIAECFGLSGLRGHRTGGSVHFIVNNQIGFTTYPRYSRSSPYPSDVAKMIEAPIFHVNGDDPEAVVFAAKVATEFRQKFQHPVVIDMFCYRRFGHNEGDEPSFTQPLMYKAIQASIRRRWRSMPRSSSSERRRHRRRGREDAGRVARRLDVELEASQGYKPNSADWLDGRWADITAAPRSTMIRGAATPASPLATLREIGRKDHAWYRRTSTCTAPFSDSCDDRRKAVETGEGIDWATAEALAFCSLLLEGHPVRLSGQDTERGTFSPASFGADRPGKREPLHPFNHLRDDQARYEVINSMLSEEAGGRVRIRLLARRAATR